MTAARAILDAAMSERQFQADVIRWARLRGWFVYHTHTSRHSEEGWPDLVLVHPGHPEWPVIVAELKREGKHPSVAQRAWLAALDGRRIETQLWKPADWSSGRIEDILR